MIIYLHGYGSSGSGETAEKLRSYFPSIITPTYDPLFPCRSIKQLLDLVDSADDEEDLIVIASSLGGWYAEKIAAVRSVDLVLFNPSLSPHTSLEKYNINEEILDSYAIMRIDEVRSGVRRHVVVCDDDEVVSPYVTKEIYRGKTSITETTGGHRMNDSNMKLVAEKVNGLINSF